MDERAFQLVMAIGVLLYGALYLLAVFFLGLVFAERSVCLVAVAACGVTYLSYLAWTGTSRAQRLGAPLGWLSIVLGLVAGVLLLV